MLCNDFDIKWSRTGKDRCVVSQNKLTLHDHKNIIIWQKFHCRAVRGCSRWCSTSLESKLASLKTGTSDKAAEWYLLWMVNYQGFDKKATMLD